MPKAIGNTKVCCRKDCRRAGVALPLTAFGAGKYQPDGLRSSCIECTRRAQKAERSSIKARLEASAFAEAVVARPPPPPPAEWIDDLEITEVKGPDSFGGEDFPSWKQAIDALPPIDPPLPEGMSPEQRAAYRRVIEKNFEPEKREKPIDAQIKRLLDATKRSPLGLAAVCDKLDLPPSKVKALLEECAARGLMIRVENDHIGIGAPAESKIQPIGIAPVVGERQKVAVISDTHLGSKYCLRAQLQEFVHYAYSQGVREILHPGDVLDGDYRHGKFEMSHMGIDAQTQDLFETLPQLPGLTYHGITGNHDFTFTEGSGVDVGRYISNYFASRGRHDFKFYGDRGAFLRVRGAVVHLWHPRSGVSYARSYALQKHIEKYSSGEKPNIMLAGHWHIYCHVYERGVHAIACPTFQGGGSAFGKSLGGAPAIGGMLLWWDLTEHGTLRSFGHEFRAYFEVEKPQQIFGNETMFREELPVKK